MKALKIVLFLYVFDISFWILEGKKKKNKKNVIMIK